MKKLFSLFLVALMIFSLAISANAEAVTKGINIDFVEDADGIVTATISAVGINNLWGIKPLFKWDSSKVTLLNPDKVTETTYTNKQSVPLSNVATIVSSYDNVTETAYFFKTSSVNAVEVTIMNSETDATKQSVKDCTAKTELCKFYFKKVDGQTIDNTTFASHKSVTPRKSCTYYTATLKDESNSQSGYNTATVTTTSDFGFTVTPYAGAKWQDTIDTALPKDDVIKFPATKDKIGGTEADLTTDDTAKKVVIFAKNTSADALVGSNNGQTANYGITIGGMFYPGFLDVPTGANWSIILVDPDGTLTAGKSYTASVTVDGVTQALTNKVTFK